MSSEPIEMSEQSSANPVGDETTSESWVAMGIRQDSPKKAPRYRHHEYIFVWGIFRWIGSIITLGGAGRLVYTGTFPIIQPFAISSIVSASIHVLAVAPLLHSTPLRPPVLWLVRFALLLVLAFVSIALGAVMVALTYEFRDEKDPSGALCRSRGRDPYPCPSDRAITHQMSAVCLGGATGTIVACLFQLWIVSKLIRSYPANKHRPQRQSGYPGIPIWKIPIEILKEIPRGFMTGIEAGRVSKR